MRTIFRYDLALMENQFGTVPLELPVNSVVISTIIHPVKNVITIYAECDEEEDETRTRIFEIVGTGRELSKYNKRFISTVIRGTYVYHVYEIIHL